MDPGLRRWQGGPDPARARTVYRRVAGTYDLRLTTGRSLHRRAVRRLAPRSGETVIDVGCGTGLAFPLLEEGIGPSGRIIGVELSPEMLAKARERAESEGWRNVELIESSAEEAEIPGPADAALFVLTHDIMRSPVALRNILSSVKPGGRVVAAGSKSAPRWAVPVNVYVRLKARRYVTTFEGFDRPWSRLAELIPDLEVEPILVGAAYSAKGTKH